MSGMSTYVVAIDGGDSSRWVESSSLVEVRRWAVLLSVDSSAESQGFSVDSGGAQRVHVERISSRLPGVQVTLRPEALPHLREHDNVVSAIIESAYRIGASMGCPVRKVDVQATHCSEAVSDSVGVMVEVFADCDESSRFDFWDSMEAEIEALTAELKEEARLFLNDKVSLVVTPSDALI
jgi:hypothetical protein